MMEKEYFSETGIFPIMHLIGLRTNDVADPTLARDIYVAFAAAQEIANADLANEQALRITLPWLRQEVNRTKAVMGDNFWPNGFTANRKVLETMIGWSFMDGMISRRLKPEELFCHELLTT